MWAGGRCLALWIGVLLVAACSARAAQDPRQLDEALRAATTGTLLLQAHGEDVLEPGVLIDTDVRIHITGLLSRVRVVQRFRNPGDSWAEGLYVFPLPDDAAVDRLRMRVDGRMLEAEVREQEKARRHYEVAKREGRRASLVEQQRPNVFTSRVANIEPGGEIAIEIEYQQSVRQGQGELSLRFPTVVAPRYDGWGARAAGIGSGGKEGASPIAPASTGGFDAGATPAWLSEPALAFAPDFLVQPPLRTPDAGSPQLLRILVDLAPGFALSAIESPYHAIDVHGEIGRDDRFEIALADGAAAADRDFELRWKPQPGEQPQVALFTEQRGDEHYALVTLLPPAPERAGPPLRRELILVLDTSGSMAGLSIRQAKAAVALALESLRSRDRFNVIEFDTRARRVFRGAREATRDSIDTALRWLSGLVANGGTEIGSALSLALADPAPPGFVRQVVFLTDGAVANEADLLDQLRRQLGDSRVFAVGIGSAPNGYLMRKLAEVGRGSFTHIGRVEEIGERMAGLFRKLESVALSRLELGLPRGVRVEAHPQPLPDLYAGEPISVALELDAPLDWVVVRGERDGQPWEATATRRDGESRPGVHVLWARRKIDALMLGPMRTAADGERRRRDVTRVALDHHLVSAFTSLVVVDRTPVRRDNEALHDSAVRAEPPAGSLLGLSQTATPAPLQRLLGLGLLLAGAVLRRLRGAA
jgi:Ca-activated chloride channel family protein